MAAVYGTMPEFGQCDDFNFYKDRLEQFFVANDIKEEKKVAILITALQGEVYATLSDLCFPDAPHTKNFKQICAILSNHYTKKKSTFYERLQFYDVRQERDESLVDWFARIKKIAVNCQFGTHLEHQLKNKLVLGLKKGEVFNKLMQEDPEKKSLRELMDLAVTKEANE